MFYNYDVLKEKGPVFIVDKMETVTSLRALKAAAVSLEGATLSALVTQIKNDRLYPEHLIITTAADVRELDKTTTMLSGAGISYSAAIGLFNKPDQEEKAAAFLKAAEEEIKERRQRETEKIKTESAGYDLENFINRRVKEMDRPEYKTGFSQLDKILDGGLNAGLYVVGAISSLGKTTFSLQLMDNIAAGQPKQPGQDVLIFSLEMATDELIAKSLSRLMFTEGIEENKANIALTTSQLMNGKKYAAFTSEQVQLLRQAQNKYKQYADHVFIFEGVGNIGVEQVRQKVERHIKATGNAPCVCIDYLQILAGEDVRQTDKQTVDKNILELKRISRDYEIPVIVISSFNRQSYTDPVNFAAFKESGAVEYSSDVLIALQYNGMDYQKDGDKWEKEADRVNRVRQLMQEQEDRGKNGMPQKIQVKVLKNRNGYRDNFTLDFYPRHNYFTEGGNK